MASTLNPYVNLPGTARQALELYASVFGGEPRISTFGDLGGGPPGTAPEHVMHGQLDTPAGTLMVSDGATEPPRGVSLSLSGPDAEQLRGWWDALAQGGSVTMPLQKQVWGDEFGMLTDKFGVPWMVNIVAS